MTTQNLTTTDSKAVVSLVWTIKENHHDRCRAIIKGMTDRLEAGYTFPRLKQWTITRSPECGNAIYGYTTDTGADYAPFFKVMEQIERDARAYAERQYPVDPAPAAVDTGTRHGPDLLEVDWAAMVAAADHDAFSTPAHAAMMKAARRYDRHAHARWTPERGNAAWRAKHDQLRAAYFAAVATRNAADAAIMARREAVISAHNAAATLKTERERQPEPTPAASIAA